MRLDLLRIKFSAQRSDAKRRGIPFLLTFEEWLNIWKASGRLQQRGHGRGRYVMARNGDRGGYELGNVRVILFEENAQEYRPTFEAKMRSGAAHRGKIVSSKTRAKLAKKARARPEISQETRFKMSASGKQAALFRLRSEDGRFKGEAP